MNLSSNSSFKRHLLDVLAEAEATSAELRGIGQEIVQSSNMSHEVARNLRVAVQSMPDDTAMPSEAWMQLTSGWEAHNAKTQALTKSVVAYSTLTATAEAAVLTTGVSLPHFSGWLTRAKPEAAAGLWAVLHRPTLFEEVKTLLVRFGLDQSAGGHRSTVEILDSARSALERPAGPTPAAEAVLLPARESIHTAIESLLRRRPNQEPARKVMEKVASIGSQCGLLDLPDDHFSRLGSDLGSLVDRLSGAKQNTIAPDDITALFDNVLQFHQAFLRSLDPGRLRN